MEMENQNSRFNREWPDLDYSNVKEVMKWLMDNRSLQDLSDVLSHKPNTGQALVYVDGHWSPANITNGQPAITNHSQLSGLTNDDHKQYLTQERAEESFYTRQDIDHMISNCANTKQMTQLNAKVNTLEEKPNPSLQELGAASETHNHDDRYYTKAQTASLISNKADISHTHDHSTLNNLTSDDHKQYHTDARGDIRYYKKPEVDQLLMAKADESRIQSIEENIIDLQQKPAVTLESLNGASLDYVNDELFERDTEYNQLQQRITTLENDPDIGVTSHHDLTGLSADDHPQYLTNTRGDNRYYTKTQSDAALSLKSDKADTDPLKTRLTAVESRPTFDPTSYYTKTEVNSSLSTKANSSDVSSLTSRVSAVESRPVFDSTLYYNKTTTDNLLSSKTNTSDTNALTTRVTSLESRPNFDSSLYYNKTSVDNLLTGKTNSSDTTALTTRVTTLEGRAVFDSSLYYTKTQTDDKLALKANITDLSSATSRITTLEARPVFDSSLYYTKTQMDTSLALKANLSDLTALTTRVLSLETIDYPLSQYGFHSSSVDISSATGTTTLLNGKLYLTRILVPANVTISKIYFYVKTIGLMLLTGTSGVALYTDAGVSLGTVISNALFGTVGWRTATLSTPVASQANARYIWVGIMANVTTSPVICSVNFTPSNGGSTTAHRRNISNLGVATFPSSITPASYGSLEDDTPLIALSA